MAETRGAVRVSTPSRRVRGSCRKEHPGFQGLDHEPGTSSFLMGQPGTPPPEWGYSIRRGWFGVESHPSVTLAWRAGRPVVAPGINLPKTSMHATGSGTEADDHLT